MPSRPGKLLREPGEREGNLEGSCIDRQLQKMMHCCCLAWPSGIGQLFHGNSAPKHSASEKLLDLAESALR